MAIASSSLPFTLVNSKYFRIFLHLSKCKWDVVSDTTLREVYLPKTVLLFRRYITSKLNGNTGCLIVDEMSKYNRSYYSFMISTADSENRVYFWKLVENSASTGNEIATLILSVINELEQFGIKIVSYASDNCYVMRSTEKILNSCGRCIKRIPCGAHILNGVFKDFINSNKIKPIWDKVSLSSQCNSYL